jgi:hypothetical protein
MCFRRCTARVIDELGRIWKEVVVVSGYRLGIYIEELRKFTKPSSQDRGCRLVSAVDLHGHILGFLDRSRYSFFQAASQLYS